MPPIKPKKRPPTRRGRKRAVAGGAAKDGKPTRKRSPKKKGTAIAERTAKAAKQAGAKGGRLPSAKQQLRDRLIVERVTLSGWTQPMAASEAGVSLKTVEKVLRDHRRLPSVIDTDPLPFVKKLIDGFAASILDFEAMSLSYTDVHPSSALGAKKAANETRTQLLAMLQQLGHTPDLARLRIPLEAGQIGRAMVESVEAFEEGIDRLPLDDEQKAAVAVLAENLRTAFAELIGDEEEVDGEVAELTP